MLSHLNVYSSSCFNGAQHKDSCLNIIITYRSLGLVLCPDVTVVDLYDSNTNMLTHVVLHSITLIQSSIHVNTSYICSIVIICKMWIMSNCTHQILTSLFLGNLYIYSIWYQFFQFSALCCSVHCYQLGARWRMSTSHFWLMLDFWWVNWKFSFSLVNWKFSFSLVNYCHCLNSLIAYYLVTSSYIMQMCIIWYWDKSLWKFCSFGSEYAVQYASILIFMILDGNYFFLSF